MSADVNNFESEVLQRSYTTPVVVDFWAEWCGPCRILGPVLERLAGEAEGEWVLAKLNTEEHPDIAAEYGIRGIPAVKMFVDGRATAEFVGALPDFQVRSWLSQSLPDKFRKHLDSARSLLEGGKEEEARRTFEEVLRKDPHNDQARTQLARLLLFEDAARAGELVKGIEIGDHAELADAIRTVAQLAEKTQSPGRLPAGPAQESYAAAARAFLREDFEQALRLFIGVIRSDRFYDDDGARKGCIAIFKLLGEEHSLTQEYRRDFSSALY